MKSKSNAFALIENYQKLVKSLNENTDCNDVMMGLDQEVPVASSYCSFINNNDHERPDPPMYSELTNYVPSTTIMNNIERNNNFNVTTSCSNNHTNNSTNNIPFALFKSEEFTPTDCNQSQTCFPFSQSYSPYSSHSQSHPHSSLKQEYSSPSLTSLSSSLPTSVSLLSSSTPSTFWSTSSSSLSSSPVAFQTQEGSHSTISSYVLLSSSSTSSLPLFSTPLSSSTSLSSSSPLLSSWSSSRNVHNETTPKSFVSELGGSGCTVLSSSIPNFLSEEVQEMTPTRNQEESLEYTDLDKLPELSFYEDLNSTGYAKDSMLQEIKSAVPTDENVRLEAMVNLMRVSIENDRMELDLPHDPQLWTNVDVARWVRWVCLKNCVPDMSSHVAQFNGTSLCSWTSEIFTAQFGAPGSDIFQELELWKSASSYSNIPPQSGDHDVSSALEIPFLESSQVFLTPSTSPAPSNGSSQDSQNVFHSSMDSSEDDVFYSETDIKPDINNMKVKANKIIGNVQKQPFKVASGRGHKKAITLWQFLRELLVGSEDHSDCIRWVNQEARIFKIEDSKKVATLWGKVKSRPAMNYDKLSRSVRQYYKKGIIKKPEQTKRLVYQFCPGVCW